MRKILSLALIISFTFIACEKKDEPEEEIIQQNTLTESTIGQSGGKLKTETFELIVPAGAFLSDNELKISEVDEESDFGENSISGLYLIEGLPDDLSKPLKIKIKYTGTLTDQSFIAAGEEAMDAASGEEDVFYELLEGKDSAGFLTVAYPPDSLFTGNLAANAYKSAPGKKWMKLEVVSNFISAQYSWEGKHTYDIYLRKDLNGLRPEIINYFDQSYNTYLSTLKFKYDFYYSDFMFGPYKINRILVTNVKEDIYCKYLWKKNNESLPGGVFVINAKKLNDAAGMQRMIAREVFRSILLQYDKSYPEMHPPGEIKQSWLNQALISWSEEFFVPASERLDYVPSDFRGNELAPFTGLDYGSHLGTGSSISNATEFGRGLSSLVNFLSFANNIPESDTLWANSYDQFIRIGGHPVEVMVGMMNEAYNSLYGGANYFEDNTRLFWSEFLLTYLSGLIYKVETSTFINSITADNSFVISSKDDTLKSFSRPYPELSAGLFKVDIQNEDVQKNSTLEITLKGTKNENARAIVFGYKDGKLTPLSADKPLAITDLTPYSSYMILVAYDYFSLQHDTYTNLELQVRCRESKNPKFTRCSIMAQLRRINEWENPANPSEPIIDTVNWTVRWYLQGKFNGNTFDAKLDSTKHGWDIVTGGGGEIILDDNNNLVSLHVLFKHELEGVYTNYFGIDCKDMEPKYDDDTYLLFEGKKSATCDYVELVTFHSDNESNNYRTNGFLCDDNSYIIIRFSDDQ